MSIFKIYELGTLYDKNLLMNQKRCTVCGLIYHPYFYYFVRDEGTPNVRTVFLSVHDLLTHRLLDCYLHRNSLPFLYSCYRWGEDPSVRSEVIPLQSRLRAS